MLRVKRRWYWAVLLVLVAVAIFMWLSPFPLAWAGGPGVRMRHGLTIEV